MLRRKMKIAVEGCCHGELTKIYEALGKNKVDLLIICGDFQAVRNSFDLKCLACPPKYRQMGDFAKYFTGKLKAPVPTLFIGGNHEASNYLFDLYHGGWVCPNIYFLGYSGVVQFGGLRIGGLSGIHFQRDHDLGYFERPPYDREANRSIYHYRRFELMKLHALQETTPLDIFISHEWPTGIYNYGDKAKLLHKKPYFRDEVNTNVLGARPLEELLYKLKPRHWLSAHLHVHFEAVVPHTEGPNKQTQFLALDKCLPKRKFLQIIDVEPAAPKEKQFSYDPEWLSIVKASDPFMNLTKSKTVLPEKLDVQPVTHIDDWRIPCKFQPKVENAQEQTRAFCDLLKIPTPTDKIKLADQAKANEMTIETASAGQNPEEIQLDL